MLHSVISITLFKLKQKGRYFTISLLIRKEVKNLDEMIMKQALNIGIFGIAFFTLLRYFLQRMEKQIENSEKREEGYKDEVKRGVEREIVLQGVIKDNQEIIRENQEIMRKQADSIGDIKEIKAILKIKTSEGVEG